MPPRLALWFPTNVGKNIENKNLTKNEIKSPS